MGNVEKYDSNLKDCSASFKNDHISQVYLFVLKRERDINIQICATIQILAKGVNWAAHAVYGSQAETQTSGEGTASGINCPSFTDSGNDFHLELQQCSYFHSY